MELKELQHNITRRDFMKLSGGTAALVALGGKVFPNSVRSLMESEMLAGGDDDIVKSYCKMCIGPACGLLVHKKDGVVTHVSGDPEHLANKGKLCPRGNSNVYNLYNPYRVKSPLKRTNPEKGLDIDPGWVEISWEEAMDTVTAKLKEVQAEDPRGLVFHLGFGSMCDDQPMGRPIFPIAFGTPNSIESNGPLCPVHFGALSGLGSFTYSIDPIRTNYLVCIGHSPGGEYTKASCGDNLHGISTEALQNAFDRGMEMVVVNPHAGAETMRGEWLPIVPGTDLAFMLAIGNVIIHELKTYDEWFLRVRSNAPYLLKEDGTYLRQAETDKPMLWDTITKSAVPFDDANVSGGKLGDPDSGSAALTGTYTVDGEEVKPAFEYIKDHFAPYTPEWAEELTTIPAAKIRDIAAKLVKEAHIGETIFVNGVEFPYSPALIFAGRGAIAHRGGANVMLAGNLINALLGNIDVPGGITGQSFNPLPQPGVDGTAEPNERLIPQTTEWVRKDFPVPPNHLDMMEFYPHRHCTPFIAWRSIVDPEKYGIDYEAKALIVFGANPLTNNVNAAEALEAFKKIPFITTISYHMDEPTQFADIILPESSNMERLNFYGFQACGAVPGERGMECFNFRYPVIDPLYDTRDANAILLELANRLDVNPPANGILNGMLGLMGTPYELVPPEKYTWAQVVDNYLKATFGDDKDTAYFIENGATWVNEYIPEEKTYNYFYFPDGQTRHAIYNMHLLGTGMEQKARYEEHGVTPPGWDLDKYMAYYQALPLWIAHPEHEAPAEFDMYAVNWKIGSRAFGMGGLEELSPIREVQLRQSPEANSILLNAQTAREKGLKDGDRIVCESQYGGTVEGVVMTTQLIQPQCAGFAGNFGRKAMFMGPHAQQGSNYNQLLSAADGEFDPVVGGIEITAAIKVTRA